MNDVYQRKLTVVHRGKSEKASDTSDHCVLPCRYSAWVAAQKSNGQILKIKNSFEKSNGQILEIKTDLKNQTDQVNYENQNLAWEVKK